MRTPRIWPSWKRSAANSRADRKHHALEAQQEALKAQVQQTTQEADSKTNQMLALATRVRASLKGKYGAKNEKLEEFGIKANRRRAAAKPAA